MRTFMLATLSVLLVASCGCCLKIVNEDDESPVIVSFRPGPIEGTTTLVVNNGDETGPICFLALFVDILGQSFLSPEVRDRIRVVPSFRGTVCVVWDGETWSTRREDSSPLNDFDSFARTVFGTGH